jgi:exosortase A-associated hydrolase 2
MLSVRDGFRFCIWHRAAPDVPSRGGILFAQPFAEEMNKSRRAVAVASREFARCGWSVLQIDLHGCGDSSGDLSRARWEDWQEDLLLAAQWLGQREIPVRILWGLRLGALLASTVAPRIFPAPDLLLWQPVLSGKSHLTQFLRLKSAEAMLEGSAQQGVMSRLRKELESGGSIEVAGYRLNPELAAGIDAAEISLPEPYPGRIYWLECATSTPASISPASARQIDALVASGRSITARAVSGPSFWQTVEIEESPALVEATIEVLRAPAGTESAAA